MAPSLVVRGLKVRFGGILALAGVDLTIEGGQLVSLIGPNGAGKTTLFNCICGLYRPEAGSIELDGERLVGRSPDAIARLGVARTFQNTELFHNLTALDNVLLGRHRHFRASLLGAAAASRAWWREELRHRRRVEEILDFLDLQAVRNRRVGDLPFGQQKMVELARALAAEPRLLLLDEPSAGMTAEEKEEFRWRVLDVRDEFGITVVLVEHDLRMVMELSERVVVLDRGVLIADGAPAQVQRNPAVIQAYLGDAWEGRD